MDILKHFEDTRSLFKARLSEVKTMVERSGPNILWFDEPLKTSSSTITKLLYGFDSGLALLAAPPNGGKSTVLVNMIVHALNLNDDLIVIDASLDDSFRSRYSQYVCSVSGLLYEEVEEQANLPPERKSEVRKAEEWLEGMVMAERLIPFYQDVYSREERILDTSRVNSIVEICKFCRNKFPKKKIACVIDAWHNVNFADKAYSGDLAKQEEAVHRIKACSGSYGIMFLCSAHLTKVRDDSPAMEDIKGSVTLIHAADWIGRLINPAVEVKLTEKAFSLGIISESPEVSVVVTIRTHKSKVSGFRDPAFYLLVPSRCLLKPISSGQYEEYRSIYKELGVVSSLW